MLVLGEAIGLVKYGFALREPPLSLKPLLYIFLHTIFKSWSWIVLWWQVFASCVISFDLCGDLDLKDQGEEVRAVLITMHFSTVLSNL